MRSTITTLLTAVILLLGVTTFAPPAAAAPALPYRDAGCRDFFGLEYCYEAKGVVKSNETPSGNTQYHIAEDVCFTFTAPTGQVIQDSCYKYNLVFHEKDGERQAYHANQKQDFVFDYLGMHRECTISYNVTYANGKVRHSDFQEECNPPL
jgi:hypothetical protein